MYLLETVFSSIFYVLSECIGNCLFQKEEILLKKTSLNKHYIIEVSFPRNFFFAIFRTKHYFLKFDWFPGSEKSIRS